MPSTPQHLSQAILAVTRLGEGFPCLIIAKHSTTPVTGDSGRDKVRGCLCFSHHSPALHNTESEAILAVTRLGEGFPSLIIAKHSTQHRVTGDSGRDKARGRLSFSHHSPALHNTKLQASLAVTRLGEDFGSLITAKLSTPPSHSQALPAVTRLGEACPSLTIAQHSTTPSHRRFWP